MKKTILGNASYLYYTQDYPYFEVIVINDNSSDFTLKKINEIKNNKYVITLRIPLEKLKIISIK